MNHSILVVDDEQDFLDSVKRGLAFSGMQNILLERDPEKAVRLFEEGESIDVALLDVTMDRMDGITLLERIKILSPGTECLMVTALNEARVAVDSLKKGAYDYLIKPISREDLASGVRRALERKRLMYLMELGKRKSLPSLKQTGSFCDIITRSPSMRRILKEAELHATSDVPVLITGESGTGKELLARAIHAASSRSKFPFTAINMASLTGNLFEAEFFGHTKGAFTGAEKDRAGYLEHSNGGTLFLDEIGSVPLELQGKLLRLLQEGEYLKLGMSKVQKANVRFIAATNRDLETALVQAAFRKDLYYRLKGAWLHVPPLKDRREDIPLLIGNFLRQLSQTEEPPPVQEEAMELLLAYPYPGNVRELKSIIHSAFNLAQGKPINPAYLPFYLRNRQAETPVRSCGGKDAFLPLPEQEKAHILKAYEMTGKNKVQTARMLRIGVNTLRRKLQSYGVG